MPVYKYKGLPKKNKDARIKGMLADIRYPEERAQPLYYYDHKKDSPAMAEEKKKRRAEYEKKRTEELKKELDTMDVEQEIAGIKFPKDKPVEVDELQFELVAKLESLVKLGNFEKVEKATK